jgi:hypothetical protein
MSREVWLISLFRKKPKVARPLGHVTNQHIQLRECTRQITTAKTKSHEYNCINSFNYSHKAAHCIWLPQGCPQAWSDRKITPTANDKSAARRADSNMASKSLNNEGPLQAALLDSSNAASKQATDAQAVFNLIAKFLDSHHATTSGLEQHLKRALTALSNDLAAVTKHHFDTYITSTVPLLIPSPTCNPPSPPPLRPLSGLS